MTHSPRRVSTVKRLEQFKSGTGIYAAGARARSQKSAVYAASRDAELLEEYTMRRRAVKLAADFHGVHQSRVLELVQQRERTAMHELSEPFGEEMSAERNAWELDPRNFDRRFPGELECVAEVLSDAVQSNPRQEQTA